MGINTCLCANWPFVYLSLQNVWILCPAPFLRVKKLLFILELYFPGGACDKEPSCQCRRGKKHGFYPWVGKIPWRRAWRRTLVFLPGESHGQSLVGYRWMQQKRLSLNPGIKSSVSCVLWIYPPPPPTPNSPAYDFSIHFLMEIVLSGNFGFGEVSFLYILLFKWLLLSVSCSFHLEALDLMLWSVSHLRLFWGYDVSRGWDSLLLFFFNADICPSRIYWRLFSLQLITLESWLKRKCFSFVSHSVSWLFVTQESCIAGRFFTLWAISYL